ncbi:MAG: response regulator [Chryseosolibacter sp.]
MNILYVDDDPDDRYIFLEAVKSIDQTLECSTVSDGTEALSFLESHKPDVVFMDINMPRMNGKTCLERIKANKKTSHLPVYMLTTSDDPAEKVQCKQIGASDFFLKPHSYRQLKQLLRSIVV